MPDSTRGLAWLLAVEKGEIAVRTTGPEAREQFSSREALVDLLSRVRPKDMATDYVGRETEVPAPERATKGRSFKELIDSAAERVRAQRGAHPSDSSLEIGVIAREVVAGMAERNKPDREQAATRQQETEAQRTHEQQQQRSLDRDR